MPVTLAYYVLAVVSVASTCNRYPQDPTTILRHLSRIQGSLMLVKTQITLCFCTLKLKNGAAIVNTIRICPCVVAEFELVERKSQTRVSIRLRKLFKLICSYKQSVFIVDVWVIFFEYPFPVKAVSDF